MSELLEQINGPNDIKEVAPGEYRRLAQEIRRFLVQKISRTGGHLASNIVFNFGYLPGGDHALATRPSTSIAAVEQSLSLLKPDGLLSLCIYSGGDSGFEERDALLAYLKELDPKKYLVILSSYYNRPNHPPIPVLIRKCRL